MAKKSSMTLETVDINDLQAHPRNYRGHPEEQIAHLKASLAEYGIVKNIVVASDNVILAGHGLVQAAREAGYKELPVCRIAMPSTDPKAQKFMVLDNEVSRKSEDDTDQLAALLKELQDSQDLTGTGYDSDEVTQLLNDLQSEEFGATLNEDAGPEEPPIEPVTRLGDIWVMGEHRLVCGDCTEVGAWDALMQGETASLLATDPPYNVDLGGYGEHFDDDRKDNEYATWTQDWFNLASTYSDNSIVSPGAANEAMWFSLFSIYHVGAWTKTNAMTNGKVSRFWCWEPLLFIGDKWGRERANDVFNFPVSAQKETGGHPCPKPLALWEDLILNYSDENSIITDCFCGSGTTVIACEKLGRQARCLELSPQWCDVTIKRWQKLTGKQAILESTGEAFSGE